MSDATFYQSCQVRASRCFFFNMLSILKLFIKDWKIRNPFMASADCSGDNSFQNHHVWLSFSLCFKWFRAKHMLFNISRWGRATGMKRQIEDREQGWVPKSLLLTSPTRHPVWSPPDSRALRSYDRYYAWSLSHLLHRICVPPLYIVAAIVAPTLSHCRRTTWD